MPHKDKKKHQRHIRRKYRCDCGLKIRSLVNVSRHAEARGHHLLNPPVKPVLAARVKRRKSIYT